MYLSRKIFYRLVYLIAAATFFCGILIYCNTKEQLKAGEDGVEAGMMSCFEDIQLSAKVDSLQSIKLFQSKENQYFVYMPSEMRTDVNVFFTIFDQLQIGDIIYKNGDSLTDIYDDVPYRMVAMDADGTIREEATLKFYFTINVPSFYIETTSGSMDALNADKNVKESARYAAIDLLGNLRTNGKCTVKARGNTSFGAEQKSYSINLSTSENLFNLPTSTEWVLAANYENSIHQLKNKIVLDIAQKLEMPYTPQSCYVNLYLNNQYNGLYLLTQKVSADGGALHLENGEYRGSITGPYLLEFDARYAQEEHWFQTKRKDIVVKYPKNVSEESLDYISQYTQSVEDAIYSDNEKELLNVIDLDTWTSMYLMQEFFTQWDVEFASFYLYKYADNPLIYAGPVWDFDLAYGNMYPGYYPTVTQKTCWLNDCRQGWLSQLDTYPEFHKKITDKYLNEMSGVLSEYLENELDSLVNDLVSSSYMNAKRWNRGETDIRIEAEVIKNWIEHRKNFLDEYFSGETMFCKVTFQFEWGKMSYHVKSGEPLGFLPTEEYGEVSYMESRNSQNKTLIGWENQNGEQISAKEIVNEDIKLYAVYESN